MCHPVHCVVFGQLLGFVILSFGTWVHNICPNRLPSICIEPALGRCQKCLTKYHDPADVSVDHHFRNMISLSTKGGGALVHPLMSAGDTNGYHWGHTYMTSTLGGAGVPNNQMKEGRLLDGDSETSGREVKKSKNVPDIM